MTNTNTTHSSDLKLVITEFLDKKWKDLPEVFFYSDFRPELDKYSNDTHADQIKFLDDNEVNVKFVDSYGGEDCGREYWSIYSFVKKGIKVYVKFEGWYESYNGSEYEEWFFVKPVPVQKIEYVKE